MQYLGGKTRIAKQLAAEIDKVRRPGQWVWDAFCGGLSMTKALSVNGPVYSTDACAPLVNMYQALLAGWDPPASLTEDEYLACKALPDTDPMKAFAGIACSFGAKWFAGYAGRSRPAYRRPIEGAQKKVRLDRAFANVQLVDFVSVEPRSVDGVLYLDPPYAGTVGYGGVAAFDHARFVQRVREWSAYAPVYVSEYAFPVGECVWSGVSVTTVNAGKSGAGTPATERLYYIARGSL